MQLLLDSVGQLQLPLQPAALPAREGYLTFTS